MILQKFSPFIWFTAFLCSLFFFNGWQLELLGATVSLVFIWAIICLSKNKVQLDIPKTPVLLLMTAFWLVSFLSLFHSEVFNVSLMAFCFFSVLPISFLVFSVRGADDQFLLMAKMGAVVFAGLAIWALIQFYFLPDLFEYRARHPLNNPNSLGALLSLGFFCAVGWVLLGRSKLQSNLALGLAVLLIGGVLVTGGRGPLYALIPALAILLFVMRDLAKQHWRCLGLLGMAAILFAVSTELFSQSHLSIVNRAADFSAVDMNQFSNNRLKLWQATMEIIKEHGLWGTGIGTYSLYFPEFRLPTDKFGTYYAHNDPLQYWVEMGFLAPVLFYAFIITVIVRTVKAIKRTKVALQRLMIIVPFCALGACVLHAHISFNLYNLSILLVVGFLLALWFQATQRVLGTTTKKVELLRGYSGFVKTSAVVLPFAMVGVLFLSFIMSEHYTNKARDHLLVGDLESFAEDVTRANDIGFDGNYRAYLLAVNVPLTLLETPDKFNDQQLKDIFNQGLSYLRHVRQINPRSSSALFYLGKIQQLASAELIPDDLKSPQEYYQQAIDIDPLHLGARMALANLYEQRGELKKAQLLLEQGFGFRYSSAKAMEFYAKLMQLYLNNGDAKGQAAAMHQMQSLQQRIIKDEKKQSFSVKSHVFGAAAD